MPNQTFNFKQFTIHQDKCAMKVGTDAVLLGAWVNPKNAKRILDVGTGTGILALMMAQKSNANIIGIDVDENAFIQANENVENCKWKDRIQILNLSLQHFSEIESGKFDLIVSNPPYFEDSTKAIEEKRTLARHNDLLPYEDLIDCSINLLEKDGRLCVILPAKEAEQFKLMADKKKLFLSKLLRVKSKPDKQSDKRWIMQFEYSPKEFSEKTLIIEVGDRHEYSEEYKELTKEFYLNF